MRQARGHGTGVALEIVKLLLKDFVQPLVIYFDIQMDEDVAQAGPSFHPLGELPWQDAFLCQSGESLSVRIRLPQPQSAIA